MNPEAGYLGHLRSLWGIFRANSLFKVTFYLRRYIYLPLDANLVCCFLPFQKDLTRNLHNCRGGWGAQFESDNFSENFLIFDYKGLSVLFEICCLFSKTASRIFLIFLHGYRGFSAQKCYFYIFWPFLQNSYKDLHNVCMIFEYNREHRLRQIVFLKNY